MVVYITGHTRGLGRYFHDYFLNRGCTVVGFSNETGYNLEKDFSEIVNKVTPESVFINNAYANGVQKNFIVSLHNKVSKMIVCGSIASKYPDISMPKYSDDKYDLEKVFFDYANRKSNTNYLLLGLTSSSYKDQTLIGKTLDFWLANPNIIQVGYNIDE